MAKVKRKVVHPNLNMRVNGVMQRMKVGAILTLDEEHANKPSLARKLCEVEEGEVELDLTPKAKPKSKPRVATTAKAPLPGAAVKSPFAAGDS